MIPDIIVSKTKNTIAVVGLGYVGLPLAVAFGQKFKVIGFDTDPLRIDQLRKGYDKTNEVSEIELKSGSEVEYTSNPADLGTATIYIVTVPTPVDESKRPDLTPLCRASETIGGYLKQNDIVIYESTVYPGATEEICVPILERHSGMVHNVHFYTGYSPERINPGDKQHRLCDIKKITSGSTPQAAQIIDHVYSEIITAGTHQASSIKVAEAAKVIENTQRDLNIALMNELSLICHRLGIDTLEVLEAAGSKWNFLAFRPGLVGGHCIGVDPYYLTHKAQQLGYNPEVILAGRRINDSMPSHVASRLIRLMLNRKINVSGARILVLGLAFKENCSDLRNSKALEVVSELRSYSCDVDILDPWIDPQDAFKYCGIQLIEGEPAQGLYDAIVLCVAQPEFAEWGIEWIRSLGKKPSVFFDVKGVFPPGISDGRL